MTIPPIQTDVTRVARDETDPRVTSIRNRQKTISTPEHRDYLRKQITNIAAKGGSEADVLEFLRLEGMDVPDVVVPQEAVATKLGRDPEVETPSFLRGLSMRALQGITFGFGDEAMGAMLGVLTGEGARGGIETYRKEMKAWSDEHKKLGFAAEIAGGLLTGGAVVSGVRQVATRGVAAAGRTLGQRALAAGAEGVAFGGVSGAGHTEGGLSERTKGALIGGAIGGAFAGTLVPVGRVAGTVARPIVRAATKWSRAIQERLPGIGTPEMHARELVRRALAEDGLDVDKALSRMADFERAGAPVSLADVGGDATMRLAADAIGQRSPAKQKLVEILMGRQSEQGDRMIGRVVQNIFRSDKLGLRNAYEAVDALDMARRAQSSPLYEAAFQQTVTVTDRMRRLLNHPKFQEAYAKGRSIASDEDLAGVGQGLEVPLLPVVKGMGTATDAVTRKLFPKELPIRALDYMKRGLDMVIKKGMGAEPTLDRQGARTLRSLLNEVLDEAGTQVPVYGQARATYRGFSELMESVDVGREFMKKAPEVVRKELSSMSPNERDFYRLGAVQALYERVGRAPEGGDIARAFFGGRLYGGKNINADRLKALFPDAPEVADDLMRFVAAETRISHTTGRTVRGPSAASLQAREEVMEGALPVVRSSTMLTMASIGRSAVSRARSFWGQEVGDELAVIYAKGISNPEELRTLLLGLRQSERTLSRRGRAADMVAVGIGQAAGMIQ